MRSPQFLLTLLIILGTNNAYALNASEVFDVTSKSVVMIYTNDNSGRTTQGSGIVVPGGDIVTNCHVLDSSHIKVRYQDKEYAATLKYFDKIHDLCRMTARDINAPPVVIGSTSNLKIGEPVFVIAAPQGLELSLSEGIVSSMRKAGKNSLIQFTAPISPGSSGGGLFDVEGKLIGIPSFYLSKGQQLNFAVPVEWVIDLLQGPQNNSESNDPSFLNWSEEDESFISSISKWPVGDEALVAEFDIRIGLGDKKYSGDLYGTNVLDISRRHSELVSRAEDFIGKGDYENLLEHARSWIASDEYTWEAWYYLGEACKYLPRLTLNLAVAEQAFKKALSLNQKSIRVWNALASAFEEEYRYKDSIRVFRKSLMLQAEEKSNRDKEMSLISTWSALARLYDANDQFVEAVYAYQQVLRILPESYSSLIELGKAYNGLNQQEKAIEAFQKSLKIKPDNANVWTYLGIAHAELGQYSQANDAFQQALKAESIYKPKTGLLTDGINNLNQQEKMSDTLRNFLMVNHLKIPILDRIAEWGSIGKSYYDLNQYDKAVYALKKALKFEPDDIDEAKFYADAWYWLGLVYAHQNKKQEVDEVLKKLKQLAPDRRQQLFAETLYLHH